MMSAEGEADEAQALTTRGDATFLLLLLRLRAE